MIYEYLNKESGERVEAEFSIKDEIPSQIERNGKIYKRCFSTESIHIPSYFHGDHNRPQYGKYGPSGRKHFY